MLTGPMSRSEEDLKNAVGMLRMLKKSAPAREKSPEMRRFRRRMTVLVWMSFILPVVAGSAVAALFAP